MTNNRTKGVCTALLCMSVLAAGAVAVAAQPAPDANAVIVQSLSACTGMANDARLVCYDRAMGLARSKGADVVVVEREQSQATKRQTFGLKPPSAAIASRSTEKVTPTAKDAPIKGVTVELASAERTDDGDWVMTTKDGAVWLQVNDDRPYHPPHAGSQVAIRPALFGAYFCTVDHQPAIRCTRER